MEKLRRYVVLGTADKHIERGFTFLYYFTVAVLILAAVVFGPVCFRIFFGR